MVDFLKVFKALSDETRLKIIKELGNQKKCACDILEKLNITQPTLSHHMKILIECELVNFEKDWKWTYYTINNQTFNKVSDFFKK